MSTVLTRPAVRGTRRGETRRGWTRRGETQGGEARRGETPSGGQRRCWPLAVTGLALLAVSIVMMTVGA
jgi:hypothetical protein